MVNHARTLLLNVSGSAAVDPDLPGEEYVPPAFVALDWPAAMLRVRAALFGNDPDRAMLNYRLRQLMTAAHASVYAGRLPLLDPRVTYWPSDDTSLYSHALFRGVVEQLSGADCPLRLLGSRATTAACRLLHEWHVQTADGATVTATRLSPGRAVEEATNTGEPLRLPGGLQYAVTPGTPAAWRVRMLARPADSLADVVEAVTRLSSDDLDLVLAAGEENAGFARLWNDEGAAATDRLAGLTLALAYQADAVYRTGRPLWTH